MEPLVSRPRDQETTGSRDENGRNKHNSFPVNFPRSYSRAKTSIKVFLKILSTVGGELLPIHSLKWNPNDVLTTCKGISKVLASGFVYWSCALRQNHKSMVLRRNKSMAVKGGTVSHYYILVIRNFIDFMSLFRHSVWFSFSVQQFSSAEFGICNI